MAESKTLCFDEGQGALVSGGGGSDPAILNQTKNYTTVEPKQ